MGYRGKVQDQARARDRDLRAQGWTMPDIAAELGVARSSVATLWTRDVPFTPGPRRGRRRGPNTLQVRKQAEIEAMLEQGREWIGGLTEREFLVAGAALYAGEGSKTDGMVVFANTDPRMMDSGRRRPWCQSINSRRPIEPRPMPRSGQRSTSMDARI